MSRTISALVTVYLGEIETACELAGVGKPHYHEDPDAGSYHYLTAAQVKGVVDAADRLTEGLGPQDEFACVTIGWKGLTLLRVAQVLEEHARAYVFTASMRAPEPGAGNWNRRKNYLRKATRKYRACIG
jgi:hypothetical protein